MVCTDEGTCTSKLYSQLSVVQEDTSFQAVCKDDSNINERGPGTEQRQQAGERGCRMQQQMVSFMRSSLRVANSRNRLKEERYIQACV